MSVAGSPPRDGAVDAVRGLALLGSAVATALVWLGGRQLGPGFRPVGGTTLDRAADTVTGLLLDNRVLPVFALLLGYGLTVRTLRRTGSGADPVPGAAGSRPAPPDGPEWSYAVRRAGLLLGLGALHAALVLEADVLGTLAVLLLLAVPLVRARARTHVAVVVLALPALLLHGLLDGFGGSAGFPDPPQDYLLSAVDRVGTWLLGLVLLLPTQGGLLVSLVLGVRLARSGRLARPRDHRLPLLLLGGVSALVGLLGALPYARLLGAGAVGDVAVALGAGALDSLTGPAGALGAVCLAAVALAGGSEPVPEGARGGAGAATGGEGPSAGLVGALRLAGRWSLPVYLVHSAALALVLAPWALGFGTRWGSAAVTGLGAGVWLLSLLAVALVAGVLDRRSRDGSPGVPGTLPTVPGSVLAAGQPRERQGRERSSAT